MGWVAGRKGVFSDVMLREKEEKSADVSPWKVAKETVCFLFLLPLAAVLERKRKLL